MATGVVFEGLQDTSIREAEVSSLARTSTGTISYLAKECIKEYDLVCAALEETTAASATACGFGRDDILINIQDARVRFKAWATNIAALQGGHLRSSLEFRLREATEVRSRVLKILESLRESLSEALSIVKGVRENKSWELGAMSDSSFDSDFGSESGADESHASSAEEKLMTSELDELLSAIKTANLSLMDISIVIRNTPTRDDYIKAAARYSLDSHWDISHVDAKFGSAKQSDKWLIQRLGKSITRRRQYLAYRKEHHDKLIKDWEEPITQDVPLEEDVKAPQTLALTKATTYVEGLPAPPKDGSEVGSFETETSYQQTVAGETEGHLLKVPPPPREAFEGVPFEFGQPFQCPYCWTEQNVKGKNAWKKHVFRDLRPYVCTFKECNLRMFRSRNEWFAHELQAHRREWTCAPCSKIFVSRSSFSTHLKSHNTSLAGSELDALILQSEEPMDRFPATACSFCDEWEEQISNPNQNEKRAFLNDGRAVAPYGTKTQFRRHLGRHMEQLALFALPRDSLDDLDDESDQEIRGDTGIDDSDASTKSTVSERHGSIRAASEGSRNEELQVSKGSDDITGLELCFRCCQCNKISPASIFKGLNCPSCDHERCAQCSHWYGHFKKSNGVWHDIREQTSAETDGAGITIRGDYEKTDLGLQRSDRNVDARAEDLDKQTTIGMPTRDTTGENTTTIFIGFYTTNITEDELLFLFHSFGDIIEVRKPNDKPFAYIKFRHRDDAERAVAEMNRFVVRGCSLLVDFAATNYAGGIGNSSANEMPGDHKLQDSENQLLGEHSVPGSSLQDEPGREFSIVEDKTGLPSQDVNAAVGLIDTEGVPEYDSTGERLPANSPNDSRSPVAGPTTLSETATTNVIRVNGLSDTVTEVELQGHFQSCGNINYLKVFSGRGFGEVEFARPTDAKLAVEEKNGSVLRGSKIQVALGYLTSSRWSTPERTDFPALLKEFGSDWHAIADCMEYKTNVMVKNYYERQVQRGHQEWTDIVRIADERLGNTTAPEPLWSPTIVPEAVPITPSHENPVSTGRRGEGEPDEASLDQSSSHKEKKRSPSRDIKNLNLDTPDEEEAWLERQRTERRRRRRIRRSVQKETISQSIGSDTDEEGAHLAPFQDEDDFLSGARRARREAKDNESSLRFFDAMSEVGEDDYLLDVSDEASGKLRGYSKTKSSDDEERAKHIDGEEQILGHERLGGRSQHTSRLHTVDRRLLEPESSSTDVYDSIQNQSSSPPSATDKLAAQVASETLQKLHQLCQRRIGKDQDTGNSIIPDQAIQEIADSLRKLGHADAATRPRTYAILHMMGRTDLLPGIIASGLNDLAIPYPDERSLPPSMRQDENASHQFLELQQYVILQSRSPHSQHARAIVRAERKAEIKRRAVLLDPPIPAALLAHMSSYQASGQITLPLTESDWEELKPKLEAERKDAEESEVQRLELREEEKAQFYKRLGRDFEEVADQSTLDSSGADRVLVLSPNDSATQAASSDLQMDLKRVKIYEMVKNGWVERGIGFCVLFRTRFQTHDLHRIIVESARERNNILLDIVISEEATFKRQTDTILVWTDPATSVDMALHFEHKEHCAFVWDSVLKTLQNTTSRKGVEADTSSRKKGNGAQGPPVNVEASAEQTSQSAQNEGDHPAERETRERREMDGVASSSGCEPSEEDIERQNLQIFDYALSDYDAGSSSFDRLPMARFNTEDQNVDRYVQKRTQELRNFRNPQETSDAPQKPNTTEEDDIAAWRIRIEAQISKWLKNFTNEVQKARTRYATTQVRAPAFVRNEVAMNQAVEWDFRAEEKLQKAQQRLLMAYSTLRNSGSSTGAMMDDRIACEKSLTKEGNSIIVDLIIALDSLSDIDSVLDDVEATDSSLIGSKEVETIFEKVSELAGQHVAADRNEEGSVKDGSVEGESSEDSKSTKKKGPDVTEEYRVGDKLLIADAGGGTMDVVTYKINELEPLETEKAASETSESTPSGIHKDDEALGQSESSKGKAPARPDKPPTSQEPTRQTTDPSTSYQPCDTLSVGNLPLDVSEAELKELFGEQRGYRRMSLRTKASGPMCYVQFEDTVCAMKALFLLQDRSLRNSVNGGIRLGFSRVPLGVRSEAPVAAIESQFGVETVHEASEGDARGEWDDTAMKKQFEQAPLVRR